MIILLQVFFLHLLSNCDYSQGQASSSYGQEFHIGFLSNIGGGSFTNLEIVVGTPNTDAEFIIESSNGVIHQGNVMPNLPVAINLPHDFQPLNDDFTHRLRGLRVYSTGSELIYVLAKNSIDIVNFGAYLAYPCQTFETAAMYEYFAISVDSDAGPSQFLLVGCENDTKITIVPTQTISIPQDPQNQHSNSANIEPGATSHQFTLHSLQTLLISSEDDLTGSEITSNKPLAVISGHQCATVPSTSAGCEPFSVQVPPSFTWGTEFLLTPFAGRRGVHTFRAVTSQGNTSFTSVCGTTFSESMESTVFQLGTSENCYLKTSKPVLFTQLSFSGSVDNAGDPAIALVSPIDQYIHETEFLSLPTDEFSDQYISVTVAAEHYNPTAILLDGAVINCQWQEIYNSTSAVDIIGYGCNTTVSSAVGNHTRHTVTHSNPGGLISVLAYGFSTFPAHGYAYLAGQELKVSADDQASCPRCPECVITTIPPSVINATLPPSVTALPETASNRATSSSEVICTKCNCSKSTVLASVITALVTALLAAVIFGAVQVAICKCCPNFTRPRARTVPLVEREGPGYKQMDDDKEGTAISEPTYTEVGPGGESTATPFTIKNEAYGITTRS